MFSFEVQSGSLNAVSVLSNRTIAVERYTRFSSTNLSTTQYDFTGNALATTAEYQLNHSLVGGLAEVSFGGTNCLISAAG